MNEYKIEKEIPIPPKKGKGVGKWLTVAKNMEIGDSVMMPNIIDGLYAAIRKLYGKGSVMKKKEDGGNQRIWRVK